jgi:hypothetical protein
MKKNKQLADDSVPSVGQIQSQKTRAKTTVASYDEQQSRHMTGETATAADRARGAVCCGMEEIYGAGGAGRYQRGGHR